MVLLDFEIEIAAPPAKVREVFLDWAKYPEWNPRHIKSIEAVPPKPVNEIKPGDTLKVQLEGMGFSPKVLENTEQEFKWVGSLPYVFTGAHHFKFEPSEKTPGGTTFRQGENFTGALSVLMNFSFGTTTGANFEKFNEDLKKRVESLH